MAARGDLARAATGADSIDKTESPDLEVLGQVPPVARYWRILAAGGTPAEAHAIMQRCLGLHDPAFDISPERISQLAQCLGRSV